jgi:hypothetical protein
MRGAYRDRLGKLHQADGGTLFLDEVGEMSPRMQAMLLRFFEKGEIQIVGDTRDTRTRTVDVRVITATNRNLAERVASGHFREDLLYRLRVIHITVPPLRDRVADIPPLVEHMLSKARRRMTFTSAAMRVLARYRWPGNDPRAQESSNRRPGWRTAPRSTCPICPSTSRRGLRLVIVRAPPLDRRSAVRIARSGELHLLSTCTALPQPRSHAPTSGNW